MIEVSHCLKGALMTARHSPWTLWIWTVKTASYKRLYTSVLRYFRPESAISVTTLAPGPIRFAT